MTIVSDPWSDEEAAYLHYGFTPNRILTDPELDNFLVFSALWNEQALVGDSARGPWNFLNPDESTVPVTDDDWEKGHPGFSHITVTENSTTRLEGTYKGKTVRWSRSKNSFIYGNFHRVTFTDEEEEVSSLLDASIQSIERSRCSLTPTTTASTLPGSFDAPDPATPPTPQPTATTSKGKTPARTQQPTPPVSKTPPTTTILSNTAKLF